MFDLPVVLILLIVIAIVLVLVICNVGKVNDVPRSSKTSEPTPLIDKSEIDVNGLYLNKMEIVSKKKFLGEQLKAKGGNGKESSHL